VVGIEDFNFHGMVSNHHLAQAISYASFGEIGRQLTYKDQWFMTIIQSVDRFFPSSQLCHRCGYQNTRLTLADRAWVCPVCGTWHDRNINSARNIRDEALRLIAASGSGYIGRDTPVEQRALAQEVPLA